LASRHVRQHPVIGTGTNGRTVVFRSRNMVQTAAYADVQEHEIRHQRWQHASHKFVRAAEPERFVQS